MGDGESSRRDFLKRASLGAAGFLSGGGFAIGVGRGEVRIRRILVQDARGRRLTPVAPNAYAPYRGHEVRERIVRIQTDQGIEGIGPCACKPEVLRKLPGLDPFALFEWDGDVIRGPAPAHRELLDQLLGADAALADILGKVLKRPAASLMGKECRREVPVYDSSLYMEDLLKPEERKDLAYLQGPPPEDPAELVARKAAWVVGRPEGIRILKIKIGRAKWMPSFEEALRRDVAVMEAVRKAVGSGVVLFVDGNDGYARRPLAAAEFAEASASVRLHAMEEMFPEEKVAEHREVKRRMRAAGMATKLADGENHREGIPPALRAERLETGKPEPLFDIDQPDMVANGLLRIRSIAAACARDGLTIAPHNFASKMGLWLQVHLGLVTPNWEFSEGDDSAFPALEARGIRIARGQASLAGEPGLGVAVVEEKLEKPSLTID